jgi:hypothetical protein
MGNISVPGEGIDDLLSVENDDTLADGDLLVKGENL